jgi:hypothetical protein
MYLGTTYGLITLIKDSREILKHKPMEEWILSFLPLELSVLE